MTKEQTRALLDELLAGATVVGLTRIDTDGGPVVRIHVESESPDLLGAMLTIPASELSKYPVLKDVGEPVHE